MNRLQSRRGRWVRLRMGLLCGLLALGLGLLVSAAFDLMVIDGPVWRELAERQRQRRLHVLPKRGTIYDRNGSALAVTIEVPSVSLDSVELLRGVEPQRVPVVSRTAANRIARALNLDPASVERKILSKRRFSWLKRRITAHEALEIKRLSSSELMKGERIRGLIVEGEGRRFYPRRELASTLLGFVAPDGEGKDGIEFSLNHELKGHIEQLRGLRDRSGRLIFAEGIEDDQALAGHNIELSLDQGIQYAAERELALAVKTYEARAGSVVAVDPNTGEILAMASFPGYNPNDYRESDVAERRDRGLTDVFEPGSTIKVFTVAAGLAAGVISPTGQLYCEKGMLQVDNVTIRDTHPTEWLSISEVLAHSSNICAAKIGLSMGGQKLYDGLRRFGFGQEAALPLPGESSGTLRPRGRPWVQVETASASFGQGISVTNLQLAMATAALANGGELMQPIVVKRVLTATGELVREASPKVRRRVVQRAVARAVVEMMVGVTEGDATGVEAAVDGYQVAGKTATAQKTDPRTGRYSLDKYVASFVGFVPAKNPVVAISVMVDEPMVTHAGGAVAAPVFRRVAEMVLRYKGLTPQGSERADLAELAASPDKARAALELLRQAQGKKAPVQELVDEGAPRDQEVKVPDLTGFPLRAALEQSFELGVVPRVQGSGLVARQEPGPGRIVKKGEQVLLILEPAS